jgi:25S rRNA (adenine2142-N1)-methyltransferase
MTKRRRAVALAPPPLQSRKKARKVTTLFHKYTRERDAALSENNKEKLEHTDRLIAEIGGRAQYQRASQVSTSFHSTSKWVLGVLARNGWLYGIRTPQDGASSSKKERKKLPRQPTRILEVGAINTELLDAAAQQIVKEDGAVLGTKYKLEVRALDLHSMHPGIEEADFMNIPLTSPEDPTGRYDVIVCSMVLNCVTTPDKRGEMMTRLFHFLRPGGLCFLTIPKSCLTLSRYMDQARFSKLLENIGLELQETKDSPKVSFFLCRRSEQLPAPEVAERWKEQKVIYRGKKYRNDFAVTLTDLNVLGPGHDNEKQT